MGCIIHVEIGGDVSGQANGMKLVTLSTGELIKRCKKEREQIPKVKYNFRESQKVK
jgi:hypothetical protein